MKVKLSGITKYFGEKLIFENVEEEFESGKINGFIGPNGGGKTTLLRMIANLDKEFRGEITYGSDIPLSKVNSKMTYLSQVPYMLEGSVEENLYYPLKLRRYSKADIESRIEPLLKPLSLETLINQRAKTLSSGEKQKVALARALVFEPELILLDEPTANIDAKTVEVIESVLIEDQKRRGTTIVIVTHNLQQAFRLCDKVYWVKDKGVKAVTKRDIFEQYKHMNSIEAFAQKVYQKIGE
ncbi:MAG: ABC transporter ATP-binding protein [Tissierellales bacterium]|jgi:tungstate transport system ATP-binding protein|nr:ABC transporter ATP-binding protein [Tissierellales bacterium]